jgi:hypothetical protein
MQIVCTTAQAAAHVLELLLSDGLRPVRDFEISPVLSITPPTTYTMLVALSATLVTKLRVMPHTTVRG